MKKDLLKKLKLQKYTSKKKDRLAFKKIVSQLEKKTNKISKPGLKILKKYGKSCIVSKYLIGINKKNKFVIVKKHLEYIRRALKRCKKKELVIFLHIHNKVTGNEHLNLLIVNTVTKKVTRIDPTSPIHTTITDKKVKKELIPFFKKLGLTFTGYDNRSKVIKHGKLCRYAAPAEYIYGHKLNHKILKKFVINYFSSN